MARRKLIVGGDDLVVLCHVRHAIDFVEAACRAFSERSSIEARQARERGVDLWPATGAELSISAGILFAPVSLPLATAIPYAESLLASAKGEGRKHAGVQAGGPTPACLDWESCTEGLLDSPYARRQRELRFEDQDIGESVELTQRPYRLSEMAEVRERMKRYSQIPSTIRHQVLGGLRAGFWDRRVFTARLGKHQATLARDLEEARTGPFPTQSLWVRLQGGKDQPAGRRTPVVDALLLLEEDARMDWVTAATT